MARLGWQLGLGLLLALAGLAALWAAGLPAESSATRRATIAAPVEHVFARVATPAEQAAWRRDVAAVEMGPDGRSWTEVTRQGWRIAFHEEVREPPARYVVSFASPRGFSGRWEGTFRAAGEGTEVTFTETVRVDGRFARVLARAFAPPGALVERYIADLRRGVHAP